MIETLINFDHNLFLILNGMHNDVMDKVMALVADKFVWIPLYLLLAVYLFKQYGTQSLFMIIFGAILILFSDQGSVLMKNIFERLRPCHNETLAFLVHTVNDRCGGQFGFVSSHAANSMALFAYIVIITKNTTRWLTWTLLVWVLLIGYNRIYVGVHFPADVIGGWIIGILAAGITYIIYRIIFDSPKFKSN